MIQMSVWVTGSFIGWHKWLQAPDEVSYLRYPHRHKFNWKAEVFVNPNKDRALEFHLVQQAICTPLNKLDVSDSGSCESIAKAISDVIWKYIGHYDHTVTVDEDGEVGATYYFQQSFEE